MATKITGLTSLGSAPADSDVIPIVDVSDTSQAASGTAKKVTAVYLVRTDGSAVNLTGGGTIALGGYTLTVSATGTASLVGHEHATSAVTSGTFDDARIAESNVTQHEAALTITESQISDLGTYLESVAIDDVSDVTITTPADNEVLAYDSGTGTWINQTPAEAGLAEAAHNQAASTITSGTFDDARVAESNVTQHEAALTITESQISDLDKEPALGDPASDGYILSSTAAGVRSWIANSAASPTEYRIPIWTSLTPYNINSSPSGTWSDFDGTMFQFVSELVPSGYEVKLGFFGRVSSAVAGSARVQLKEYGGSAVSGSTATSTSASTTFNYAESSAITLSDNTAYILQASETTASDSGYITAVHLIIRAT